MMKRSLTMYAAALLVLVGLSTSLRAQTNENDIIRPITKSGSAAFLFTLQGLGTFGIGAPSIGTSSADDPHAVVFGAGMKYYFQDDMALRLLLAFNNSSHKTSDSSASAKPGTTDFGIGAGIEYHFRPLYSTSPYIGGQISFSQHAEDNDVSGANSVKTKENSFGVAALAGFDWFFTRGLAVGAEYSLGFATVGGSTTTPTATVDHPTTTIISLAGGGNVHMVVYF